MFWSFPASSTLFPCTHSVANDEAAIADPQPNVLNFASSIIVQEKSPRLSVEGYKNLQEQFEHL